MPTTFIPGAPLRFPMHLFSFAVSGTFQTTPTIAASDFVVSFDDGEYVQMLETPAESPVGSGRVLGLVTATETAQASRCIDVKGHDPDSEWGDIALHWDIAEAQGANRAIMSAAQRWSRQNR